MARTKEYKRKDVVERAMSVFWQKGFEGTSISDLTKATGLNTFSMYREFGNKEGLFEAALERYYLSVQLEASRRMRERPGFEAIREFFKGMGAFVVSKGYKGCLFNNAIAGKENVSQKAMSHIDERIGELAELFERSIREGQKNGEIGSATEAKALASYLLCFAQGLTLYGRTNKDKKTVNTIIATALSVCEA
jgi:TetR/AcrR family transcriptional repressor of nem operon